MNQPSETNEIYSPSWKKPLLEEELGELERAAEEDQRVTMHLNDLVGHYQISELEDLNPEQWNEYINTSSRDPGWTLEQIIQYKSSPPHNRDVQKIINGIKAGLTLPAPIVLFRKGHPPYVIGGDTRLLVCRAMGVIPKIVAIRP